MSRHAPLEEEVLALEQKAFTSVAISSRLLKIGKISVSRNSSLAWSSDEPKEGVPMLLEDRNLAGTLSSLQ